MFGIPTWGLGLAGALALAIGAYFMGDSAGANRVIARDAREAAKAARDDAKRTRELIAVRNEQEVAEGQRRDTVREIYRDVPKILERPVYRDVCGDADGLRLLRRAAANANGDRSGADAASPEGASPAGDSGPGDGRRTPDGR